MEPRSAVLKLFSGNVALAIIEFGAVAGFTRALGPAAIGSFFLFQTVVGLLSIPVDLGISKTVEKQLSADEPFGAVFATAVSVKSLLALPWVGALLALDHLVESYVGIPGVAPLVVIGLLVKQARGLSLRLLAGDMQVGTNATLKLLGKVVWVAVGFALISVGWDAMAIVAAFVTGHLVTVCGALLKLDLRVGWPEAERARAMVAFGRYLFVGSVGGFVYQWMDVAILRLFVPVSMIGAYEIAWRVASVSLLLTEAIRTSLFPQISQWHARERLDEIEAAFRTWLPLPLYLTIPAFAGAVVLGRDVLGTLFGPVVVGAYPVLVVFMLEKILRSVQLILGPSLYAMDKPQLGYRGSVAAILANCLLNVALVPAFDLLGAAVATTLSAAIGAAVSIRYVSQFVPVRMPWLRLAWSGAAATVMAGGVTLLLRVVSAGWLRVGVGVGVGVVVYGLLLLANDGIRLAVRDAIRHLSGG